MCVCVCVGGKLDKMGGGANWIKSRGRQIGSKDGGGGNWPKVVFLFLIQGEKWGGGANDTLAHTHRHF